MTFLAFEKGQVSTLFLYPQTKLGVLWVVQWYLAMVVFRFKRLEKVQLSVPSSFLCIPCKIESIQQFDTLLGNGALFAIFSKLVLFSLFSNPAGMRKKENISVRASTAW